MYICVTHSQWVKTSHMYIHVISLCCSVPLQIPSVIHGLAAVTFASIKRGEAKCICVRKVRYIHQIWSTRPLIKYERIIMNNNTLFGTKSYFDTFVIIYNYNTFHCCDSYRSALRVHHKDYTHSGLDTYFFPNLGVWQPSDNIDLSEIEIYMGMIII